MKKAQWMALLLMLLSTGTSLLLGLVIDRAVPGRGLDLQVIYYGTRCIIQHHDPYQIDDLREIYSSEERRLPPGSIAPPQSVIWLYYLPTVFIVIAPLSMLPWWSAYTLWMTLLFGGVIVTSFLLWKVGSDYAPRVALFLICLLLSNMEIGFTLANPSVLVISLCIMAVWCFINDRFVLVGTLCLASGLAIKPHDAGLVWLYFLLAGGVQLKRAVQTLAIVVAIGLLSITWVSQVSPHWIQEWHSNVSAISAHGGFADPGPDAELHSVVIDLQAEISVFWDDPHIYNTLSYIVCGSLLIIWAFATLRSPFSKMRAWFALAAVVPVAMLVTYHRLYDTKLLLLTVPACTMLWAQGGKKRWVALAMTAAGFTLAGDLSCVFLQILADSLHVSTVGLGEKLLTLTLLRPVPIVLLAMAVFYLWVYVHSTSSRSSLLQDKSTDFTANSTVSS
ncbi:MAG: glycosyltransferase family 87 protein [Terracidiphilus sp.]